MNADQVFSKFSDCAYDLGIGEPVLLQQLLQVEPGLFPVPTGPLNLRYPALGGHPTLVAQLQERYPDYHVVVTNGGRQALAALLWSYRWESKDTNSHRSVRAAAPYFPAFKTLAEGTKMSFTSREPIEMLTRDYYVNIVTAPGNPEGGFWDSAGKVDIWDAAYASPVYGWVGKETFDWEVKVETASKMFGVSGLRVGWLVTKNKDLADSAALYVERTTSGVCNAAQLQVAYLLKNRDRVNDLFRTARAEMAMNYDRLEHLLGRYCTEFSPNPRSGGLGMFAWFRVKEEHRDRFEKALAKTMVRMFPGHLFGMVEDGYWRASLCQDVLHTTLAVSELGYALRGPLRDSL